MSGISIIGLGNMARILGTIALAGGNTVEVIGRDAGKAAGLASALGGDATAGRIGAAPAGDIVILAVPYASAAPVVGQYGDALAGKVIVDITNPFDRAGFTGLVTPDGSSAAQEIAKAAPSSAHVVKAFNTLFGHVLAAHQAGDRPLDVFIAGDDAEAKARVSAFIESLGLRPLDTGDLKMARWLEGASLLMMRLAIGRAVKDSNFSLGINSLLPAAGLEVTGLVRPPRRLRQRPLLRHALGVQPARGTQGRTPLTPRARPLRERTARGRVPRRGAAGLCRGGRRAYRARQG
jgi:8-hydroxy-5-deazaflavin:NADPH oxidoreductase